MGRRRRRGRGGGREPSIPPQALVRIRNRGQKGAEEMGGEGRGGGEGEGRGESGRGWCPAKATRGGRPEKFGVFFFLTAAVGFFFVVVPRQLKESELMKQVGEEGKGRAAVAISMYSTMVQTVQCVFYSIYLPPSKRIHGGADAVSVWCATATPDQN